VQECAKVADAEKLLLPLFLFAPNTRMSRGSPPIANDASNGAVKYVMVVGFHHQLGPQVTRPLPRILIEPPLTDLLLGP